MSTGCAMMLGMLVTAYSFLHGNGFILLEEPEVYLHPKAIMDLVQFFRNISETKSVIFTTHSPVVLNSMWPEEVTLMVPTDGWKSTTRNVATIKEALDSLDAGFLSFGDLLQNNFNISAIDSK
jgi:predicted ATPase